MKTLPLLHPVILALAALVQLSTLNPQLCAQQATNCTPAPSGLVSWWPGDGFALDVAGTNNAALQGGAGYAAGEVGKGFSFDGTSGFVSTSLLITNPQAFSLSLWFKTSATHGGVLLSFGDNQAGA